MNINYKNKCMKKSKQQTVNTSTDCCTVGKKRIKGVKEVTNDRPPFTGYLVTREIQVRKCVYISRDIQQKIARIVGVLADGDTTIGGYIDNVIEEHLNLYRDEINALYRERQSNLV